MKINHLLAGAALLLAAGQAAAQSPVQTATAATAQLPDSVYLMAYFTSPQQHLFYAWSDDGLNWKQANGGQPVFDAYDSSIWMRDPYLSAVTRDGKTTYHLVHTWGWDNPAIFHWQSDDLRHWTAANGGTDTESGKIYVMDGKDGRPLSPNAWAPEFTYVPEEDTFYIYWSSRINDRQQHYVTTTRDWLTFTTPRPLFDPGFTAIDLTVVRQGDTFYGFYKDERNGEKTILATSTASLNPDIDTFRTDSRRILPDDYNIEAEGPTVFRKIGGDGYIGYFDKFIGDTGLSYITCSDLRKGDWQLIPDSLTTNVPDVKHGSVIIIPRRLLQQSLKP